MATHGLANAFSSSAHAANPNPGRVRPGHTSPRPVMTTQLAGRNAALSYPHRVPYLRRCKYERYEKSHDVRREADALPLPQIHVLEQSQESSALEAVDAAARSPVSGHASRRIISRCGTAGVAAALSPPIAVGPRCQVRRAQSAGAQGAQRRCAGCRAQ
eukprot:359469-Chlamydomonas_euryale.AAC.1